QPNFGGPPPGQPGFGQPQPAFGGGGSGLPGALGGLPASAPGTIFGFPVSRLRDAGLQRTVLLLAGIALVVSIVVPYSISPFVIPVKNFGYTDTIFPIITGGLYLLVAAAPPNIRNQVPPAVLQWIPFVVSYWGIFTAKVGMSGYFALFMAAGGAEAAGAASGGSLYCLGYAVLVFGLLARIAKPTDQTARIIIAVGACMLIPDYIDILKLAFHFGGTPILMIVHNLIWFVVVTAGVACIAFVVPPQKLPPAIRAVDNFAPVIAAVLIAWLVVDLVLMLLVLMVHAKLIVAGLLIIAHALLPVVAYFGVLMMAAPAAYEEAMRMFGKKDGGAPPPQQPPQGGGYPPPGGGYPQQGGGYPPQGGGYPQQGGGGYPPQQGGGQQGWG
ncbi:MAG: hypothetical protein KIT31_37045, partial [Deltaproteobacteria bacterium]|nr:hypothetical protein [Deltaproteobacteria bacterium]